MENLISLQNGDKIALTLHNGEQREFQVFIGDALLNGDTSNVWLKTNGHSQPQYLRKNPEKPLTVGVALFKSINELHATLSSGNYYIA